MADLSSIPDAERAPDSGVWWDGMLNPMSPAGLRAALAQEEDGEAVKASDIRWVAWPGLGQRVHVSQVEALAPFWVDIETRRLKRLLLLAPLGFAVLLDRWYRTRHGWLGTLNLMFLVLALVAVVFLLRDWMALRRDPRAWGMAQAPKDARRAGLREG